MPFRCNWHYQFIKIDFNEGSYFLAKTLYFKWIYHKHMFHKYKIVPCSDTMSPKQWCRLFDIPFRALALPDNVYRS